MNTADIAAFVVTSVVCGAAVYLVMVVGGDEAVWKAFGLDVIWDWLIDVAQPPAELPAADWCQGCDYIHPREVMSWVDGKWRCLICAYGTPEMVQEYRRLMEIAHG